MGTYHNAAIGVFYATGCNEWSVFNQHTRQNIPIGAAFNTLAFASEGRSERNMLTHCS
jgi:hypothetical protein